MKNEFDDLIKKYETAYVYIDNSKNLEELKDYYITFDSIKNELIEWVVKNFPNDEEKLVEYSNIIGKKEFDMIIGKGVPVFGSEDADFDFMENLFDENISYFQRYGCLDIDQLISWDNENVLIEDEIGNVEIIKRPDVLLNV